MRQIFWAFPAERATAFTTEDFWWWEFFWSGREKAGEKHKKTKKWKQSDKTLEERRGIQKVIKIDKSCLKNVKRVLIVDDVLTSGSTIRALISQLPPCIDKKVLVLSSNCRISSNEIV